MENASKALIIAGGVLLAMMILSLLVYVATSMTDMAESQDRITLAKQIKEFNDGYLSYNKTRLYGTDVITVVNKAINHNKTVEATEVDPYYINVIVKTVDEFKTTGTVINTSLPATHKDYEKEMTSEEIESKKNKANITFKMEVNEDGYALGSWSSDETLQMNKGIIGFFEQNKVDETIREGEKIYYIYSALTNFKTAIFECETMEDTEKDGNKDGRIDTIVFKQIKI